MVLQYRKQPKRLERRAEILKIDNQKLDLLLARRCMSLRDLRNGTSPQTLTRIRRGESIKPVTVGRIAKALDCDPTDIIQDATAIADNVN